MLFFHNWKRSISRELIIFVLHYSENSYLYSIVVLSFSNTKQSAYRTCLNFRHFHPFSINWWRLFLLIFFIFGDDLNAAAPFSLFKIHTPGPLKNAQYNYFKKAETENWEVKKFGICCSMQLQHPYSFGNQNVGFTIKFVVSLIIVTLMRNMKLKISWNKKGTAQDLFCSTLKYFVARVAANFEWLASCLLSFIMLYLYLHYSFFFWISFYLSNSKIC